MKLLDINETAEFLKIKKSTIYAWVHRKEIPFIKMGGKLICSQKSIFPTEGTTRPPSADGREPWQMKTLLS